MRNFFRGLIRASAFLRKEIFEILRQPRLIFTLVLGPFLILLIFGIGYRSQARALRALVVTQPGSTLAQEIQQSQESMGAWLIYAGSTEDQPAALDQLARGQVDLFIVEPEDAYTTIKSNQQAVFTLYHQEIDPAQVSYVEYIWADLRQRVSTSGSCVPLPFAVSMKRRTCRPTFRKPM